MAGMLNPTDIASIIKNNMLMPISEAQMNGPYPAQANIPPPPMPQFPPQPSPMINEAAMMEAPVMPEALGVNPMFQSQEAAPIPMEPQAPQQENWGQALDVLGQFANQIGDAQARANLPADLYLKMKQQQNEVEMANQDRLLKNMQMEADVKYRQQALDIQKENLALQRAEMMGSLAYRDLQSQVLQRQLNQPELPSGVSLPEGYMPTFADGVFTGVQPLPGINVGNKLPSGVDIPEGYMPTYDETGMFTGVQQIPGLPEGPKVTEDVAKLEGDIRKEFDSLTKPYREVRDAYTRINKAAESPSAAGDLALIFNYMKMLDPGSTVREGEFATATNSAGVPDIIRAQYNKVKSVQRLASEQRNDFLTRAGMIYQGMEQSYNTDRARYEETVKQYGLDPMRVLAPATKFEQSPPITKTFNTVEEAEAANLPTGTEVMINGRRAVIE